MRSSVNSEPIVIIRQGLLRLCSNNGCAAAILNDLWYWAIHKQEERRQREIENEARKKEGLPPLLNTGIWVYKSEKELAEKDLLGIWGWRVVSNALDLLLQLRLIQRRHNPIYKWDKTYQYALTEKALKMLIPPNGGMEPPNGAINGTERGNGLGHMVEAIPEITTEITTEKKTGGARAREGLDPEMVLSEKMATFADEQGVREPGKEFERFKAHHLAEGNLKKDWGQAWRTWCMHPIRTEQAAMLKKGNSQRPMLGPGFENLKRYMEKHANGSGPGGNGAGTGKGQLDHPANERSDDRGVGGDIGRGRLSGGSQRR